MLQWRVHHASFVCSTISTLLPSPPSPPPLGPLSGEDKVTFSFNRTKLSNNGTDASAGQLPSLLNSLGTEKDISSSGKAKEAPEVPEDYLVAISKKFSLKVTQVSDGWWMVCMG